MPTSHTTRYEETVVIQKDGFSIVKPKNMSKTIPLFCPVCTISMSGLTDMSYYERFECCSACGMLWADLNQEAWMSGWRPEKSEIKKEFDRRSSIPVSFSF